MPDALVLLASVALSVPVSSGTASGAPAIPRLEPVIVYAAAARRDHDAPDIDLWIQGPNEFRRGDVARVEFRPRDDAHVTIFRVDTDGRIHVLYPESPLQDSWVRAGRTVRVPGRHGGSFAIDDYTGMGYIFAVASYDRFDYRRHTWQSEWDHDAFGGRVRGDPFQALDRIALQLLWDDRSPYSTAYAEYYVDRRVDYPRYVCYDCHAGGRYDHRRWDPYDHHCTKFRIVIYSDPHYYPYRYYRGTRVVYARQPRYEFKEASRSQPITSSDAIERRRRDDVTDRRRPNAPASDPNLGGNRRTPDGAGPGSTRPGDDTDDRSRPGRRRGHESDGPGSSNDAPGHTGQQGPRRDPPGHGGDDGSGPGNGTGNGNGGGGSAPEHPRRPRSDRGNQGGASGGGSGNDGGNGSGHGPGSDSRSVTSGERDDRPAAPRRDAESDDPQRAEGAHGDRPPRGEARRESSSEPRREARGGSGHERSEPRGSSGAGRSAPRSEPRTERRSEPGAKSTRDRSSSKSSGASSGSRSGGTRRRSP